MYWRWFSGLWRSWSCPSMLTNLPAPTVEATNANSLQLLLWLDTLHSSFWWDLPVALPLTFSTLTAKIVFLISLSCFSVKSFWFWFFFAIELCLITLCRSKHDLVCHYRMSPPQVWTQRLVGSYGTWFLTSSRPDVLLCWRLTGVVTIEILFSVFVFNLNSCYLFAL